MLVHKYFVRPLSVDADAVAQNECAAYSRLREQYRRLRMYGAVPFGPITVVQFDQAQQLRTEALLDGRRKASAEKADDRKLLQLAAERGVYALENRRCCYTTARLAQQAAAKAEHPLDQWQWLEGRAGMLPEWVEWSGAELTYCGYQWSVHAKQLIERPVDMNRVKQMWIQRERWSSAVRTKPRWRWYLIVVLDQDLPKHVVNDQRCAAGLDIGWRHEPGRPVLRAGYIYDEHDEHSAICMTDVQYARLDHADSVEAIADRECGDPLRAELKLNPRMSDARTVYRAANDPRAAQLVHLVEWAHGAKARALRSRDQHYLMQIHDLCRKYHTIYVENIKGTAALVARAKTRKAAGEVTEVGAPKRGQRQRTAPFVALLRRLQYEAQKFGTLVVEVEKAYTSRECSCGVDMGASIARERRCLSCGRSWDVDHLAARNLLARGTARKAPAMSA